VYSIISRDFGEEFRMGTGLRLDYDLIYGLEVLPQANLSYSPGRWTVRGSAGRSIRSPDFTERYISTGLEGQLTPGRNLGNPDLLAEHAWSLEIGADRYISKGIQARLSGFYRFGRDLIDYVLTVAEDIPENDNLLPGGQYFYSRNIGLLNTGGLEIELKGRHSLTGAWTLDWGLSYQGLVSNSDSALVSKYLANHSRNLMTADVGMRSEGFRMRINAMYKDRDPELSREINERLTARYMLLNVRLDKYIWKKRLELSIQVNNILDAEYSDIMGARMPGRWIQGGIIWNFAKPL
jgi:iron complex outermembrane receptor protein